MTPHTTTLERAYQLARSGQCAGVEDIRATLKAENYHDIAGQLYGRTIARALRELCVAARAHPPA